ncbi:hypothetical protein SAMN04487866_101523 [Thermoactinomyces sp. DSM 45891]|uniref:hypothetical protein n=1 Tax=Thermoactinomyces sp. DSM 45891 TaxID=1761907 RepID=UPI00091BD40A|nr:hypothetical protein [Thermoactinomyces sp. DSM 45891]SFX09969.1 hypothetical protein SAMN04487866_101523 [Thermoactinomyces sp. DSM 45891]
MYSYRVTKYNPEYRVNGAYTRDEWTSVADVGKAVNWNEYLSVENNYVNAVIAFMEKVRVSVLEVSNLEKYDTLQLYADQDIYLSKDMDELYRKIKNGVYLKKNDIEHLVRIVLREYLWCKLVHTPDVFVHFGYDYYMYFGCSFQLDDEFIQQLHLLGLFVEEMISPYNDNNI